MSYIAQLKDSLKTSKDLAERVNLQGEIGVYLRSLDQFVEAEAFLQEALQLIKENGLGVRKEIQSKIRLAHVFQEAKQFKKSDSLFCETLKICQTDSKAAPLLHFALQHAGKNEFDQGNLLPALQYFEEALSIRLRDSAPSDQRDSTQTAIARVKEVLAQKKSVSEEFKDQIEKTKTYLASESALNSIERDPYWPKWDSPWWHMRLLHELGLANEIPTSAVKKMVEVLKTHYLPIFPVRAEEVPPGTDPYRKIACHCAVGSMYQVLFSVGIDVDLELPWMRPWMIRYQLPDGGLNCDEQAYTKENPKSSIVSTINCLEAIFFCRKNDLTPQEINFLDKGAQYLQKQKLFRRASNGEVIDPKWLEIKFPRFYEYDFLRGYYFLAKWSKFTNKKLPPDLTDEVRLLVGKQLSPEGITLRRYNLFDKRSYNPLPDGSWHWGDASEFELYKAVSREGVICTPLTAQWDEVKS
ncbi:MAG: tetratricopeptide repeat protein [Pseudobdellovibrionaceae bacterium]